MSFGVTNSLRFFGGRALAFVTSLTMAIWSGLALQQPVIIPAKLEVTITATGEKNAASSGREVWLRLSSDTEQILNHGWEQRDNNVFVSYQNQPATLHLRINTLYQAPIQIARNQTSGRIVVRVAGHISEHDLFSEDSTGLPIDFRHLATIGNSRSIVTLSLGAFLVLSCLPIMLAIRWLPKITRRSGKPSKHTTTEVSASFMILASWIAAAHVAVTNGTGIGAVGFLVSLAWYLLVLCGQLALLALADLVMGEGRRNLRHWTPNWHDVMLLVFLVININAVAFEPQPLLQAVVQSLACVIAFLVACRIALFEAGARAMLTSLLVLGGMIAVRPFFLPSTLAIDSSQEKATAAPTDLAQPAAESNSPARRPNIYFLSLDALGSPSSLKDTMGLMELPLWELLTQKGFSLGASNSPASSTAETFYRIFTGRTKFDNFGFLNGLEESYILTQLRASGYRIQSIQGAAYFGVLGNTWDYADPSNKPALDFCWSVSSRSFLHGICKLPVPASIAHFAPVSQIQKIHERVKIVASSSEPWFTFAHVLWPGHVSASFDPEDASAKREFARLYRHRLNVLQEPLDDLLSEIVAQDRDAIMIIHGDHGPLMSRNWKADNGRMSSWEAASAARDRQEVLLAVRPANICNGGPQAARVTSEVLPKLFECLGISSTSSAQSLRGHPRPK